MYVDVDVEGGTVVERQQQTHIKLVWSLF